MRSIGTSRARPTHKLRKVLLGAVLLLAASACATNPVRPQSQVPIKEDLAQAPERPRTVEEQLRILTRTVEELQAEVGRLRKPNRVEMGNGPYDHLLWP